MILSFHPIITADENRLCAGRDPGPAEGEAMARADAVILPQACRKTLYDMATALCPHVFPDYTARFKYPGKIGQAALFADNDLSFPRTRTFAAIDDFYAETRYPESGLDFEYPMVFKFDWGGEGDTVFYVASSAEFDRILDRAEKFERTGQKGFLIQEFVPTDRRSLRVAAIGERRISYFRVPTDPSRFGTALSKGAAVDHEADPDLQRKGVALVDLLCEKTGINLAGMDVIFRDTAGEPTPLLLEINYFFGRNGLGGSAAFYELLAEAVNNWLKGLGLSISGTK
ncbi:MAG: glutathione synthase [Desulfobacterales bacterium CG23_combo_of_CG06-09_8_20_14_all_51_8]|nr:MAG: glutathione synthase [Desulfobacterales bacterium CG23_combo_of_CG06-09_8_20_14_all_51_8]